MLSNAAAVVMVQAGADSLGSSDHRCHRYVDVLVDFLVGTLTEALTTHTASAGAPYFHPVATQVESRSYS